MTDQSPTERLRAMLDERGAFYEKTEDETTIYYDSDGNRYTYSVSPESEWAQLYGYHLTPEQAIAATLGSEFNPDGLPVGLTVSKDGTLLNWRGENYVKQSTLGSGKLTAEQVERIVDRNCEWYEGGEIDAQAIADELNDMLGVIGGYYDMTLGSGTCEMETDHDELELIASSHEDTWGYRCSACGWVFRYDRGIKPDYCPNCGRKVVSE